MFKWIHIIHIHAVQESTVISYCQLHQKEEKKTIKRNCQTSLEVQWLAVHLPIQGDLGSSPGPGRSHMPWTNKTLPQLLSLCSRVWELQLLYSWIWSPCSTTRQTRIMRSPGTTTKRSFQLSTIRECCLQHQDPHNQK